MRSHTKITWIECFFTWIPKMKQKSLFVQYLDSNLGFGIQKHDFILKNLVYPNEIVDKFGTSAPLGCRFQWCNQNLFLMIFGAQKYENLNPDSKNRKFESKKLSKNVPMQFLKST